MSRLIIIRGNSGSGKTTVARALRNRLGDGLSDDTMLVQQDILRRDILRERDYSDKHAIIELIELVVEFGRKRNRTVILEGIMTKKKYIEMLTRLAKKFDDVHVYYFDLSFEETLKRHASKPNAHEFGEKEMREWWREQDSLGWPNKTIIGADVSAEEIVEMIVGDIGAEFPSEI